MTTPKGPSSPRIPFLCAVAWLGVWSLLWFGLSLVGAVVAVVWRYPLLVIVAFPFFLVSSLVLLPARYLFRCPTCRRRLLVQGGDELHPKRSRMPFGLASWVAICLDIALRREFTCLHCGQRSKLTV